MTQCALRESANATVIPSSHIGMACLCGFDANRNTVVLPSSGDDAQRQADWVNVVL